MSIETDPSTWEENLTRLDCIAGPNVAPSEADVGFSTDEVAVNLFVSESDARSSGVAGLAADGGK